jgi:shikimate kinase
VGKTAVANILATRISMTALDFDEIRAKHVHMPEFRLSSLNLVRCLPILLRLAPTGFVLDVGGDTVFRPNAKNDARLTDLQQFKNASASLVVVLTATRDVLLKRFLSTKGRSLATPNHPWEDWERVAAPYWAQCADFSLDTSSLDPNQVASRIELRVNARQ